MLKDIIRLAHRLDKMGLKAEALYLDGLIEKMAKSDNPNWPSEYIELSFLRRVAAAYALSNNLNLSNKEDAQTIKDWLQNSFKIKSEKADSALKEE